MISILGKWAASAALIAASTSTAHAISSDEVDALNFNGNDFIEPGRELDALSARRADLNSRQRILLADEELFPTKEGIPVSELKGPTIKQSLFLDANPERRFFLRETIEGVSLLTRDRVAASDAGASFSFGHDNLTDVSSWSVKGAAAWLLPIDAGCSSNQSGPLSGCAFAPYLEFQGDGTSSAKGQNSLTFGLQTQFEYTGGEAVQLHHLSMNPFFTTDFDGDAEIYGLSATWRPTSTTLRLNAYPAANSSAGTYWWSFFSHARYQRVESAGRTGFVSGDDYGWIGGQLAFTRLLGTPQEGRLFAKVGYDYYYDVINDRTADLAMAEIGVFIDETGRNSVVVSYSKGRSLQGLAKVDGVGVALRVGF